MTFRRFIVKNAFRNKRRTVLTILSIGFSLFLLILLRAVVEMFSNPPQSDDSHLRVIVQRSTTFVDQMPISHLAKVQKVAHVKQAIPFQIYPGIYKDPKNFFGCGAVDPAGMWEMFPEMKLSEAARQAFLTNRRGAIVGDQLMARFGWKVGERVTLLGSIFPVDLDFDVVGTYHSDLANQSDNFWFRLDYLSEALGNPGTIAMIWVKADSAEAIPGVIDAIDTMFHNSPAETRTQTEKSFVLGFLSMMGNIRVLMGSIAAVVIFTMILVVTGTMSMTIRERIREVAILKSMGYPRGLIFSMILGESAFIALIGAVLGCGGGTTLRHLNLSALTGGFIREFPVSPPTYALAVVVGLLIGLISALSPAFSASRMTITEAIRRIN